MHKIKLVVRLFQDGEMTGGYVKQIKLPFVPQLGMKFEQGISCRLWETEEGKELTPKIESVIYDLDEEEIVCLFTVNGRLASTFWTELKVAELGTQCAELKYFRHL